MNSGMYAAISGNLSAMRRLEVLSNNLANANTPAYKADQLNFESVLAGVKSSSESPVFASEQFSTDYSQGSLQKSGNTLDLALDGSGFFVVNTPNGPAYTRQGNFHRGTDGKLLTPEGYEVQGKNGAAITVGGSQIEISGNGTVTNDGAAGGTVNVVDFPKPYALKKIGGGLFVPADPQTAPPPTPSNAEVKQGFLESSNVQVVVEMARMIEASRYFEQCTKLVKSYDDVASKAANDLGRV
ncbi:flagellar basal-body rod protein FlgF [Geomonas sp. RF6]|uniref:flagellar basal-body rod protein FlgF n=1 Tax=Geomonas sp. RF6 TaxID=2897342 RepID=UPI001E53A127|nr:flagellar basal-body rod protein FlgF [Geomonas sp. RF6]UFS72402.1 flagellar basal-body rod protein FlgF [Geomonas sp. RF6]